MLKSRKLQTIDFVEVRNKLRTITSQMLWVKERQRKNFKALSKKKVVKDLNKDLEANVAPKNYTMKPSLLKYLKPVDKGSKSSQKMKPVHRASQQPSKVQKILGYF